MTRDDPGRLASQPRGRLVFQSSKKNDGMIARLERSPRVEVGGRVTGNGQEDLRGRVTLENADPARDTWGGQKKDAPVGRQRVKENNMRCGNCKGEHATIAEIRTCSTSGKGKIGSDFRDPLQNPPATDATTAAAEDGRCTTPGCVRRTSRDQAGEFRAVCSTCHDAGVRPDFPGLRRDYQTAEATSAMLTELRDRPPSAREAAVERIRGIREELRP